MVKFPIPHSDELIYSIIGRYKIRSGIIGHKLLLDEVFENRKVVSTLDLPSHVASIEKHFTNAVNLGAEMLIYKHTLFPIYAPFVDETIRQKALGYMRNRSQGAAHLSLGVAASILKSVNKLTLCIECAKNQVRLYGESYWDRTWFLPELPYCRLHGRLTIIEHDLQRHRHEYLPCASVDLETTPASVQSSKVHQRTIEMVIDLLKLPPIKSPSRHQWTTFYRNIANSNNCIKGKNVNHEAVLKHINQVDMPACLLKNSVSESYWLRSIFRKHRKTFSYLQHIYVWQAFLPKLNVKEIIDIVINTTPTDSRRICPKKLHDNSNELTVQREWWTKRVLIQGIKEARFSSTGRAKYAWLYRYDREWLLSFNKYHCKPPRAVEKRVDWYRRDRHLSVLLKNLLSSLDTDSSGPRRSKQFLISHLPKWRSASKNLHQLKRLNCLLNAYQETVPEYQTRRIQMSCLKLIQNGEPILHWKLMRLAGLSTRTITLPAVQSLTWSSYFQVDSFS